MFQGLEAKEKVELKYVLCGSMKEKIVEQGRKQAGKGQIWMTPDYAMLRNHTASKVRGKLLQISKH